MEFKKKLLSYFREYLENFNKGLKIPKVLGQSNLDRKSYSLLAMNIFSKIYPRGGTSCSTSVSIAKVYSFRNQAIQIWRWDQLWRIIQRNIAPGHIISIDNQNIWAIFIRSLIFGAPSNSTLGTTAGKRPISSFFLR